jgi:hypothetical protein
MEPRRRSALEEYEAAVTRLRRVRATRFLLFGQIRRCLDLLGDQARSLVGPERYRELRREADALTVEPDTADPRESEELAVDPALAWMEADLEPEVRSSPPSLPPPPSADEADRAGRTLRQCVRYLDEIERSIPDLHLAILESEARLKALGVGIPRPLPEDPDLPPP